MTRYFAELTDRFISITGPDAIKFLQGQCSCDLMQLSEERFSYGTLNTPKGRMYAFFKIISVEQGLLLSVDASILDDTLARLKKYAVFFKCTLSENTHYKAYGLSNTMPTSAAYSVSRDAEAFTLTVSQAKQLQILWLDATKDPRDYLLANHSSQLNTGIEQIDSQEWLACEAACGIPALYAQTQEAFILQTLNLQHLAAVSFKKGCYTGQEIVARMKFLGKLKKQTYLLSTDQACSATPDSSILDASGTKVGTVVRSHYSEKTGAIVLAIMNIEDALSYQQVFLAEHPACAFHVSEIDYSEFAAKS